MNLLFFINTEMEIQQYIPPRDFLTKHNIDEVDKIQKILQKYGQVQKETNQTFITCGKILDAPDLSQDMTSKYIIKKNEENDILYILLGKTIYSTTLENNSQITNFPLKDSIIGFSLNDNYDIKIIINYEHILHIYNLNTNNETFFKLNIEELEINILWMTNTLFIIYTKNNIYIYDIIIDNINHQIDLIDYGTSKNIININNKNIIKIIKINATDFGILYDNEFIICKIKSHNNTCINMKEIYIYNNNTLFYYILKYKKYILLFSTQYVYKLNIKTKELKQINYKENNMKLSNIINIKVYNNKYIIICHDYCIKIYNFQLYLIKEITFYNKIAVFDLIDNKVMTISIEEENIKIYDIDITKQLNKSKQSNQSNQLFSKLNPVNSLIIR